MTTPSIEALSAHEKNPRRISEAQYARLEKTLEEFGDLSGVVFNSANGKLVGGHMRTKVFQGLKSSIVITDKLKQPDTQGTVALGFIKDEDKRYSYREVQWNEEQHEKAMLIANKAGGDWDFDMLANNWDVDFLVDEIGFDSGEFGLEQPEELAPTEGDDDIPESAPAITVKGDLYELGNHRVLCGDSTMIDDVEKLMDGHKADMLFTDPPYGYKYKSNYQDKHEMIQNDDKFLDFIPSVNSSLSSNCAIFVFGGFQTISKWIDYIKSSYSLKNLIVWKKNHWSMGDLKGAFAGQYEMIIYAVKGKVELKGNRDSDVWEFDRDPPKEHPTQKPIDLITYAITKIPSSVILDPFLGSGSTLISSEKAEKICYGMELDEKYCDVITKRYITFCRKNNKTCSVKRNGEDCLSDFED